MRRRNLICFTFLALFLFPFVIFSGPLGALTESAGQQTANYTLTSDSPSSFPPPPEGPIYTDGQYQYEGLGTALTTTEYAEGSNLSLQISDFDYNEDRYGQVRLPRGWTGYRLEADVYNLYDQPYFIQGNRENGNFNTIGAAWTAQNNGMGDNTTNPYYGTNWGASYGYSGNGVQTWVEWWSGWTWNVNSYVVWRNPINILRDDPVYAKLTFRVRVNLISGNNDARGRMVIYCEIAGIIYRLLLEEHCPNNGQWYQLSISVPYDDLQTWAVPGSINVRLGLSFTGTQTAWNYAYWGLDFDDVTLEVRGLVNPNDTTWLDLEMNETIAYTTGYGYGSYSRTGTWANPTEVHKRVVAHWQVTNANARLVGFNYNLTLFITRDATTEQQVGTDGSVFTARNNSVVYWTTWVYAYQPYFFSQYNLSITRPTTETWTLYKVLDALFTDRTSAVTTTSTHFVVSTSAINDVYGWWNFTFSSTNQISSVTGVGSTYYIDPRSPSTLSFTVYFATVTSGDVNWTIFDSNNLVVDELDQPSFSGPSIVFNVDFTNGNPWLAGTYTLCVSYDNGDTPTQTTAGFYSAQFDIEHDTTLTAEQTPLVVSYGDGTEFFYPRVSYDDIDRAGSPFIDNSTGTVTVTGQVSGYPMITFEQTGSLYQAIVPNNYTPPGDHNLVVTANDPYYEQAQTTIVLQVRSDATLTSPESPGLTIPYDEQFTVQVFYEDEAGDGISGATVTTNWPTNPTGSTNGTPGWYDINIDTADQPGPGTYSLTIQALRNYYTTRTIVLTIVVREISTTIDFTPPGSVPWDEDVVIDLSFFANDADSTVHDGDPISTASFTFQLDGSGLSLGTEYTINNHGDGTYTLTILASSGRISTIKTGYELIIQGDPTNAIFGDASRTLYFNIRSLNMIITYVPPPPEPWGNDVIITLNYTVDDPDSTVHNGDNIAGLLAGDVSLTLDGTPLLSFGWTPLGGGQYNLTIYSSSISTVKFYTLIISVTHSNTAYQPASRTISFQVLAHQTQTIVDQPDPTPYGQQTSITITWRDLDGAVDLTDTQLDYLSLEFINGTGLPNEFSLSFILDTSSWNPNAYEIIVTAIPGSNQYLESSGTLRITILIHQTAVTVLPPEATPWGRTTNITIQWFDLTAGGQIDVSEVSQIVITGAISTTFPNPSSWTITVDTSSLGLGTHGLTITVEAKTGPRIYADSSGNVNVIIRNHRVYVLVTGPAPVPEDGTFELSISWTDLDTGLPIDNGTYLSEIRVTQISGPTAPTLPWSEFSNLDFIIDALGWGRGTHRLNITVYANDPRFDTGFGTVNVIIRVHSINADVDPIPRVPYGNDILIILRVNDSDLIPPSGLPENHIALVVITGGPSTITLDASNWFLWVTNGTADDGIYDITLDVSSWALGTYILQFNVYTSVEYGNGVVTTQLTIRPLATSFIYQSPPVVPWGEDGKLIVTYLVDDPTASQDTDPVTGGSIVIAGLTQGVDFNFVYWQNGKYNITFYSSYLTTVQTYNFDITITSAAQYENRQLDAVPLSVRALFTWLHPTDVPITPFGDNVTIDIEYVVLDGESLLNGQPVHTGSESITVTGLDGFNPVSVSWQWVGALSVYRITIDASDVTDIQAYRIMISISGSGSGYEPDTIPSLTFNVRTVFTAMAVAPVDAQAYLENFTIQITYTVNDPDSSINGYGIEGQASIMELVGYSGLYTVYPLGSGVYNIVINSTSIGAPGSYLVTINTDWTQSPPPYAIQTRQVTLFVTERPTTIRNTIAGEFGYLDDIRVNFTYLDELRLEWILNTSYGGGHIFIMLYNSTPAIPVVIPNEAWYIVAIMGSDAFQIRIDADYFGIVNVYFDFKVEVTWRPATVPYFEAQEFEFRAYVVGQRTDVILQPSAGATPYDSNIIIGFQFVTELGETINETDWPAIDITLLCQQVPSFGLQGTDWDYTFLGDGFYEIWVDSTRLAGIGSYTFFLNVTYPGGLSPFFESQYNEPATRLVRYINTLLEYIDPGSLYSGDDLNLTIRYWNLDNSSAVPNSPEITFIVTSEQSRRSLGGGWWEFMIDTSGLPAGAEFDIYAYANQFYYIFQNISVPVYIFEVPLEITLEMPTSGVINRYYGETPFPIVIITLQIGAGSDLGNYVTDASVIGYWDHGTLPFTNELNGTYWIEISSLFDKGAYFIEINASKVGYFSDDIRIISYTITAGPSQLDTYLCGPTTGVGVLPSGDEGTSFILYANQLYFIGVWFRTLVGDNITGAIVTYSSAFVEIGSGSLPEVSPGIYGDWFDSSTYGKLLYSMEVVADTAARNVQSQRLQFQLDVRFTPAKMQPENGIYYISVEYFENFTIIIYLNDTLNNQPIENQNIIASWGNLTHLCSEMTGGYYNFTFPAIRAAGFTYELYLDFNGPGSFDCPRATLTIQITPRQTNPIDQMDIVSVRGEWNNTINFLQVPVGDWLYIYLKYTDADGVPIPDADGLVTVGDVSVSGAFYYDAIKGLYVAMLNASLFGRGTHSLRVTISRANFESNFYTTNFEVIRIPTELLVTEIDGISVTVPGTVRFFIGAPVTIRLYLNDTWHNEGIDDATLSLPPELLQAGFQIVPLGNGYYDVRGTWGAFALTATSVVFSVSAEKTEPLTHETARLTDWVLQFEPPTTLLLAVYGGAGAAITLIFVLVGWLLWIRIFSIPWEVRRMRSLAKTVEKEEGYTL
ncbi:MAG: hypothetical protein ACFFBX_09320, partial [Promethearchaeota archaeon]